LEHALGREALRLSFQDHHKVAVELKGVQIKRSFDDVFDQTRTGQSLIKPGHVDAIIGSGGLLSHAPQRAQALLLLLDSLQPQGFTRLYVDRAFMMPHLGALSELDRELALEVLVEDCLIPLATVIAPAGKTGQREPNPIADVTIRHSDGSVERETIDWGTLKVLPFAREQRAEFEVVPRGNFDLGDGPGRAVTVELAGGRIGIVLDGRGRPIQFAREGRSRQKQLMDWIKSLDAYPLEALERYRDKYAGEGIR
jgi:hypothetical protein